MAFKSDSIKKLPNPNILNGAVMSSDENDGYADSSYNYICDDTFSMWFNMSCK